MRFSSHARSIAPCRESRRSIRRVPCSNSRTVMTREERSLCVQSIRPCLNIWIGSPDVHLSQFGRDVCVEQIHHERSAGRKSLPLRRGGSKSTWSAFGMASASERVIFFFPPEDRSILFDGQKHMRRAAAIGDKHRALSGGALGAARVLIEFPAGKRSNGHGAPRCSNVATF